MEQAIISQLKTLLDEHLDIDEVVREMKVSDDISNCIDKLKADKEVCKKRVYEYAKAAKALYMDKVRGIITEEEFINYSKDFSIEKEIAESAVKDLDDELTMLMHKQAIKRDKHQIAEEYSDIKRLDRVMVEKLIDHIRVGKRINGTKCIDIEVHWSF